MYTALGSKVERRVERDEGAGLKGGGIGVVEDLSARCLPLGGIVAGYEVLKMFDSVKRGIDEGDEVWRTCMDWTWKLR